MGVTARTSPGIAFPGALLRLLTEAAGIDGPVGSISVAPDGRSAAVLPKGDGTVYVRCSPANGHAHPAFIVQRPLTFSGYGKPFLDPYGFISGGLYTDSNVALTNGNERGVATLRDGESHVGFRDLDFGGYGSHELSLWLFPLEKEPFTFEFWEGMPLEGGTRICDVTYDKGSIWNTYQPTTYHLPRRLRGITTLCLVFRQKVHIKGFQFTHFEKAFQQFPAADNDGLYGDSFAVREGAVEGIGNNVTIVWKDMDFGVQGARNVALCWRSKRQSNSIQFMFSGEPENRRMIEVGSAPGYPEYMEAVFSLGEAVSGSHTVSLVFLPGCEIDLAWVKFIEVRSDE